MPFNERSREGSGGKAGRPREGVNIQSELVGRGRGIEEDEERAASQHVGKSNAGRIILRVPRPTLLRKVGLPPLRERNEMLPWT